MSTKKLIESLAAHWGCDISHRQPRRCRRYFHEINGIIEDYPRIMSMLNEFISQEVDEYKHMKHEPLQGEK